MPFLFSLILAGATLGQTPPPVRPFPDVPKTHWAYAAVTELHEKGILQGYPGYYDRSTPHAALRSLIKAIHNDDEAMIQELTSAEWREYWIERLKRREPDDKKRMALLHQYSSRWDATPWPSQSWKQLDEESQHVLPGIHLDFLARRMGYTFQRESAGWKIAQMWAIW